jgi:glutamate N-acetyltransferase/amino-acid N-acetyltransferase
MSVTFPKGFRAGGAAAGIKAGGAKDLAIVVADEVAVAAAVFTRNIATASPVRLSQANVSDGRIKAVVLSSGCANAGTGEEGDRNAARMAEAVGEHLHCPPSEVLVCSTGPIGPQLPIDKIEAGISELIPTLSESKAGGVAAAEAIMTTDTFAKTSRFEGDGWSIGGMAKAAGMCRPDMATLLVTITTDAVMDQARAQYALQTAVDETFNSLNIDGCSSTNDTAILLASGASGESPGLEVFLNALNDVCESLARQVARDGEGTQRVVDVAIEGAPSHGGARVLGLEVTDSDLVRASFYGGDPNWGRILQALGQAGVGFDPTVLEVSYAGVTVASGGQQAVFDRPALMAKLTGDFRVEVKVGSGPGKARIISTDLTPEYVLFNGEPS